MKIIEMSIKGLQILEPNVFKDNRGTFVKIFTDDFFKTYGLNLSIKESYYSISHRNVIRGMHFQIPPYDHVKLVYVPFGKILDVVLDLRKESPTYGKYSSIEISSDNGKVLVIPKGLAHGFKSLEDNTNVTYLQTTCYHQEYDFGIKYDSFNFDWNCIDPKISERDKNFIPFDTFHSPFIYESTI